MRLVLRAGALGGVLLLLAGWLFLGSELGLGLLRQALDGRGGITLGSVEGRLAGRFSLGNIALALPGLRLQVDRLLWEWQPLALLQGNFHLAELELRGVVVHFQDSPEESPKPPPQPAASTPPLLPEKLLPLPLLLDRVAITGLRLEDQEGGELLVIDNFLLRLQGGVDRLHLQTLELQGPEIGLSLHGSIDFTRKWQVDLLGSWNLVNYGFHPLQGTLSARGPLEAPQATVAIHSPVDIRVTGQVSNLLRSPAWSATLDGRNVDLERFIKHCPQIVVKSIHGDLSGNVEGYGGLVKADVDWGLADNLQLETTISAGLLGIDFDRLLLTRDQAKLRGDGASIDWKRLFDWRGHFVVENFDPSMFLDELPGSLSGEIDNVGTVRDDLGVDAAFTVRDLRGTLHGRPISGEGDLVLTENDIASHGFTFSSGEVAGRVEVQAAKLSWAEHLAWQLSFTLDDFDPSGLFPDFPGSISGRFGAHGVLAEGGGEGYLRISEVAGVLRGHELAGNGEIVLAGESLATSGLFLQSGPSKLVVEGRAGEAFALDFSFDSPDLNSLLPESGGAVQLRGRLRGSPSAPRLEADLSGKKLTFGETTLNSLTTTLAARFGEEQSLAATVEIEGLGGGMTLARGRLATSGNFSEQRLEVDGVGSFGSLKGHGELLKHNQEWRGKAWGLQLFSELYGEWYQQGAATLNQVGKGLEVADFCVAEKDRLARACLGGTWQDGDRPGWRLAGQVDDFSLALLNGWQLVATPIGGKLSGELAASGEGARFLALKAGLAVPELHVNIGVEDEEVDAVVFEDAGLTLDLVDSGVRGALSAKMRNGSRLALSATLGGSELDPKTMMTLPLSGELHLAGFNLAMLSVIAGYGIDPVGRASGDFTLGGTLGRPQLIGEGRLDQGGINLPYQGISLEGIRFKIEAAEDGAVLSGRMVSGPGEVRVDGRLHYGMQGLEGRLHLAGRDFLLVNLPEWAIRVDPAIDLTFSKKSAEIKGMVRIPNALLTPEEMKDSVRESADVVVVNGREEENAGGWPVSLDLDILLGEAVRIDGYGLSGRLGGGLRVKTAAGELPTALGELDLLEGSYTIYGRTLDIARGRILFTGGPIDNPGVDVRAQRTFSDDIAKGGGYTVGVDISGLAQDLKFQLFSDPYMDDTEILSQLIVGHSLAFSTSEESGLLAEAAATLGLKGGNELFQGIGSILQLDDMHLEGSSKKENVSLVVGKRLTKDLYIGYDVNMFSQLGRFRVRYDLSKGFAVETSSSSQSTGADLLYSFEK